MSDNHGEEKRAQRIRDWKDRGDFLVQMALTMVTTLLLWFILRNFSWFLKFEEQHGYLPVCVLCLVVVIPFQHFYRRKHYVAKRQTYSADLRQGRVKRGSLASRYAVILVALGLVVAGLLIQGSDGAFCLL